MVFTDAKITKKIQYRLKKDNYFYKYLKVLSHLGLALFFILIFEIVEVLDIIDIHVFNILIFALIGQFLCKTGHIFITMYKTVLSRQGSEFVALGIEFAPQHIFQFVKSQTGYCGDEYDGQILRQCFLQHLNKLLIEKVTLGHCQDAMLVEHLWIKLLQLI